MAKSLLFDVDDDTTKRDVGSQPGTRWTLSSFKQGSGVEQLRSRDMSKLWQSDGNQPHLVNIQFSRRTAVTHVSIYLDCQQDDSYTPTKLSIRAGTSYHDLVEVRSRTFDAPQGWKHFLLDQTADEEDLVNLTSADGIWVWLVQVCVLANHLNGKDTHIRRMIIWGPPQSPSQDASASTTSVKREREETDVLSNKHISLDSVLAARSHSANSGSAISSVR